MSILRPMHHLATSDGPGGPDGGPVADEGQGLFAQLDAMYAWIDEQH